MKYPNMERAKFLSRPNRFLAYVETARGVELCHVKNTGRCAELLVPEATVYLVRSDLSHRKTPLDLVAVEKGDRLINMDSVAPNAAVAEWLPTHFRDATLIRPEYKWGDARFDFYVETPTAKRLVEVKGVTLEQDGVVRFPDAPTERGVKHLNELVRSVREGYEAYVVFVIQMANVRHFEPNDNTHKAFGDALRAAKAAGVHILCYDTAVTPSTMTIGNPVPIQL